MSIHAALHHRTTYSYDRPIALSPQTIRLRPAPHCRTPILSYALHIEPQPHFLNWVQDPHGNFLARVVFPDRVTRFDIQVDLVADMAVINPFDFFLEPSAETFPFAYDPLLDEELAPFRRLREPGPLLAAWLASVPRTPRQTVDFVVDLNRRLAAEITYVIRMEHGVQTPEETLATRHGSCRDTGWLLVQILRHLGFAARFASGYLIQLTADQKPLDGPAGPERDFTDLHAWAEVYLPGSGWIGLDPTSGLLAAEGHIPLAASPEPPSAAPVTGLHEPTDVAFGFDMTVRRLRETPRVTKPYTDDQWQALEHLGREVDRDLVAGDVRLTMGGEPTFVSIDDMDGAEWNTAALGTRKRELAGALLRRLADRLAPGALLHYGQGKWYPGEPLPRWALGCYWRKDGEPTWRDRRLLAEPAVDTGTATAADARAFIEAFADRLKLPQRFIQPAYEDTAYYLWREARLPVNVEPGDARLRDPLERTRFARLFDGGLGEPAGYVLPLTREPEAHGRSVWRSAPWRFRTGALHLVPGDSPLGLRLPLDTLPWVAGADALSDYAPDPFADRPVLPARADLPGDAAVAVDDVGQEVDGAAPDYVRTALCVEVRSGHLYLFTPPLHAADDYLALIAAIEDTAAALGRPVVVEGYPPPHDPRIATFSVTPDPGVIEVNVQPTSTWDETVALTHTIYEEARQTRLGTEKFMLDGRHTGTGGGNHFVVGGPSAADSPLLRRPDLLRSLLAYWNNHPSLSYLFSGLFIGPTSQHPRVDEARDDALYELEIAFRQVPEHGETPPWLVDRLFRNLLVDLTGNTHRAEFCIDKLYAPDGPGGRRGLLELRAFEMPPHLQMSLAQQLLLRALVAWFWREPYRRDLVRWGTRLHDEFMLPHVVWRDFEEVVADLVAAGYAFAPSWYAPHREFRFPVIGEVAYQGVELELRQALEPWHVMGEQAVAGGTTRAVDSSIERMQVRVRGQIGQRFVVACNGHAVPLRSTGTQGEYVAAVRYRAWQPPTALHPTIPVHSPLRFDVYDTWSAVSVGGCTYHVAHPGGRNFETFPVNGNEAEARRRARFFAIGHMPAGTVPQSARISPEHPYTLDLRYVQAPPKS